MTSNYKQKANMNGFGDTLSVPLPCSSIEMPLFEIKMSAISRYVVCLQDLQFSSTEQKWHIFEPLIFSLKLVINRVLSVKFRELWPCGNRF